MTLHCFIHVSHIMVSNRWALYPPGRVPAGVTVHVNEDDGDVNIDTPSSLQVCSVY